LCFCMHTLTHECVNVCMTQFAWVKVKDVWMRRDLLIVFLSVDMRRREKVWHRSSVLMWRGVTQHGATAAECLNCASALLDGHKQCVEFERGGGTLGSLGLPNLNSGESLFSSSPCV